MLKQLETLLLQWISPPQPVLPFHVANLVRICLYLFTRQTHTHAPTHTNAYTRSHRSTRTVNRTLHYTRTLQNTRTTTHAYYTHTLLLFIYYFHTFFELPKSFIFIYILFCNWLFVSFRFRNQCFKLFIGFKRKYRSAFNHIE